MSVFIVRANMTLRTLCIHLWTTIKNTAVWWYQT